MDMFGKATADSVSSSKSNSQKPMVLSKAASRKVMDDACLSSQACAHTISLIDKSSHRYLLPGNNNIPTESRLLTEEDLERRAVRALALRMFSMDEFSPDSVGIILETASRDTIDSLARLGYYDQAISVALGVSSKRKALHSYRLPEKGSMDYVPYGLIDMLWNMIESIIASNLSTPSEDALA